MNRPPVTGLTSLAQWLAAREANQWRWFGSIAAVTVAVSSWLCGATPTEFASVWPGLTPWRPIGGSPLACTVLFAAMGGLVYAWWALREHDVTCAWLRVTALAWFAPLLLSAPLFSRDVYSYAATGMQLHLGGDPYHAGVRTLGSPWVTSVSRVWLDTPAPYGPLYMELARLAASCSGGHLLVAIAILRGAAAGALVVIAWAVPTIARSLGTDPVRATWLGLLAPLVGTDLVSGTHNDALMIAGILAAIALALHRRPVLASVAVAAAIAIKVPAVVVLPFVALLIAANQPTPPSRRRLVLHTLAAATMTVIAFIAISTATGLGFSWAANLSTPGKTVQWTSLPTGLGMGVGALGTLLGRNVESSAVALFRDAAVAGLVLVLVFLWLRAVRCARDPRLVTLLAGQALVCFVILGPAFHSWYFLWALPVLAVSVTERRWITTLAAVSSLLCFSVLPGGFSLALDTAWVGVPLCFAVVAWAALAAIRWIRTRRRPSSAVADGSSPEGSTL